MRAPTKKYVFVASLHKQNRHSHFFTRICQNRVIRIPFDAEFDFLSDEICRKTISVHSRTGISAELVPIAKTTEFLNLLRFCSKNRFPKKPRGVKQGPLRQRKFGSARLAWMFVWGMGLVGHE